MNKSLQGFGTKETPQDQRIPGRPEMVENYAGGFGWEVDDWAMLNRFLFLGTEGGTYYVGERELTQTNCEAIIRLIKSSGVDVVNIVAEISDTGRAYKNDYALFVLAMCAGLGDRDTRRAAFAAVPKVARIGTHVFHLIGFAEQFRGWGRGFKGAIAGWYNNKSPRDLVYQVLKYQSRDTWSQRDVLRSCHPKPTSDVYDFIYRYVTHGVNRPLFELPPECNEVLVSKTARYLDGFAAQCICESFANNGINFIGKPSVERVDSEWRVRDIHEGKVKQSFCIKRENGEFVVREDALSYSMRDVVELVDKYKEHGVDMIEGFEEAKRSASAIEVVKLIREYGLPRECIPSQFLKERDVWNALLTTGKGMPLTAMIRNLGNMSKCGLLVEGAFDPIKYVTERVTDQEILGKARIHPLGVLAALNTYGQGHGVRSESKWPVVGDIMDALDKAFYLSFDNIVPTNQRICIGLDVSGSMGGGEILGIPGMQPRMGACAMLMVTYRTEPYVAVTAFSHKLVPVRMQRNESLKSLIGRTSRIPMGGTDCALPILWATEQYKKNSDIVFDAFIVYTDYETWYGDIHPCQALNQYRRLTGRPVRMATVGLRPEPFTIADPKDSGTMDFVGFDTAAPAMLSQFLRGEL